MNFYLIIFLGIVLVAYGIYVFVRKNAMIPEAYGTILIGCILLLSPNGTKPLSYVIVGLILLFSILYRRSYVMYNTDLWRVKEEIRKILEKHNIKYSIEDKRILLNEDQGLITLGCFAKIVRVNFNNAAVFNRRMIRELKDSKFNDESAISYSGLVLILLGILYIGTAFIVL